MSEVSYLLFMKKYIHLISTCQLEKDKFNSGALFLYLRFFVHLSAIDANCKTFPDWAKLIPENRKLLMSNFFENDNALFSKFVQEAASN